MHYTKILLNLHRGYFLKQLLTLLSLLMFLIPSVYVGGWLIVSPFHVFLTGSQQEGLKIIGTIISFTMFLIILPNWIKFRWGNDSAFEALGFFRIGHKASKFYKNYCWIRTTIFFKQYLCCT